MEEILYGIISADENIRNSSITMIFEMMENDDFVGIIFNCLKKCMSNDQTLTKIISICLFEYVKKDKDQQIMDNICINIFDVVFSIPNYECRKIFMDIIRFLCITQKRNIEFVLKNCLNQIDMTDNSLMNYASALYLLNEWIFLTFINVKFINNEIEEFSRKLIPKLFLIINKISEDDSYDQILFSYVIISVSDILKCFINKLSSIFDMNELSNILAKLALILSLENDNINMYKSLSNLFSFAIIKFKNINAISESLSSFSMFFQENILPIIYKSIYILLTKQVEGKNNQFVIAKMFSIIKIVLFCRLETGCFFSYDFIKSIIVKSCYLTEDDLSLFYDIPEQFVSFNYLMEENIKDISPRIVIARIIKFMGENNYENILNLFLSIVNEEPLNQFDFEAKLYIFSCLTPYFSMSSDIFQKIIGIISSSSFPIIISTAIYTLKEMKINKQQRNQISKDIMIQSQHDTLKLMAIHLFSQTFDILHSDHNVPYLFQLFQILIQFISKSKDSKSIDLINLLICQYTNYFIPSANEIIDEIIYTYLLISSSEDCPLNKCNELLNCIQKIVVLLDNNDFSIISQKLFKFCLDLLSNKFFENSYYEIITLLECLIEKIDEVSPSLIDLMCFLIEMISSNFEENFHLIPCLCSFLAEVISKKGFFEVDNNDFIQNMFVFLDSSFSNSKNIKTKISILFLYSKIIQVGKLYEIVNRAIIILHENVEPEIFVSCFYLISSSLLIDPENTVLMIDEIVLEKIMNNWSILKSAETKFIKLCFIGFCVLAKLGNQHAFENASLMIEMMLNKSNYDFDENEDEYLISNIDQFDELDFNYLDFPDFNFPFDSIDIVQVYKNVINTTDMFETLPIELKENIEKKFLNQ